MNHTCLPHNEILCNLHLVDSITNDLPIVNVSPDAFFPLRFANINAIIGPEGPQGPAGEIGPQGIPGIQGPPIDPSYLTQLMKAETDKIKIEATVDTFNSITAENVPITLSDATLSTPLQLRDNLIVEGLDNNTILNVSSNTAFTFKVPDKPCNNLVIRNLTLDMTQSTADTLAALHLKQCNNVLLENVTVINGAAHVGIYLEDCTNVTLVNCQSISNKYGFSICGTQANNNIVIKNCKALNNSWDGFLANTLKDSEFVSCIAEGNGHSGIDGTACGFYLSKNTTNVKITNCYTKLNGGRGIELEDCYGCKVTGNVCDQDNRGVKIIGTNESINANSVINNTIVSEALPIVLINTVGNILSDNTVSTTVGDTAIFEDTVLKAHNNIFSNIICTGAIQKLATAYSDNSFYTNCIVQGALTNMPKPSTKQVYIDFTNGVDTNTGALSNTPVKTVAKILTLINTDIKQLTIKVLGDTFCTTTQDLVALTTLNTLTKITFDFEGRTVVNMPNAIIIGSNTVKNTALIELKSATLAPTTAKALYNYGATMYFSAIIIPSNLTVECLNGGGICCNSCTITPAMKKDNGSYIVKDRWDSTSTIHVSSIDLSPV